MPVPHGDGDEVTAVKDWLFDFLLSVFKSPQWDVAVMGFIDENCAVFDTDEENKLSYTELHQQFKDLVSFIAMCSYVSMFCIMSRRKRRDYAAQLDPTRPI